jgi:hypothetical protein
LKHEVGWHGYHNVDVQDIKAKFSLKQDRADFFDEKALETCFPDHIKEG